MATYTALTFLAPFAPTDTVLKLVNSNAQRTAGVNVCQYEKSSVEGNELWIFLEDAKHRILQFSSPQEALQALVILRAAIEALRPNCFTSLPVAPPQTINAITLAAYKAQQIANSLIPLQWYDVADNTSIYDLGPAIRVQAKTSNDFEPSGISLTTNELVTLNVLDDTIARRENTVKKTLAQNRSTISASDTSAYINATNFSNITALNSNYLEATNNSVLEATNSTQIYVSNGANVVLEDASNVFIEGLTIDFSFLSGLVNDVNINQTDSIGKLGRENLSTVDDETLLSYVNLIEQVTPTLVADISKILENPVADANGEFRILVGPNLGSYTITIKDTTLTPLLVISAGIVNSIVTFRWNKTTSKFVYVPNVASLVVIELPVIFNGQTSIAGIAPTPINPTLSTLEVNGLPQVYGVVEDYYITGDTFFWTNNDFQLEVDDTLILKYT